MADLVLTEPIGFWGGLDPETGRIVDRRHPQYGECIRDRVLVLEHTRGSTSSPGTLVEAIRLGNGPSKIVLSRPDMVVLTAVFIAGELYGIEVPLEVAGD